MSRKPTPYNQILHLLHDLHKRFPTFNMGRHLATALDGYGDVWGLTDKELLFALEKYMAELDMDVLREDESEIDRIIKDGMDLDNILKEEQNGEDY
jgi:hypothetical protein